ncbi:hypothetical protein [Aeromonas veronii]|uniref:hypothetical protein n=1 Tax=Aeromonas veronii TaxID=654 RepID=UPI003D1F5443
MRERLFLLQQNNVISINSANYCLDVARFISQEFALTEDNEQLQMAITHLARAYDRIIAGEIIKDGLEITLYKEVVNDPAYQIIIHLHHEITRLLHLDKIPETEEGFLLNNWLSLYYAAKEINC